MPCAEFEDRLLDYDQLSARERELFDQHTQRCADCRSFLSALMEVDNALSASLSGRGVSSEFHDVVFGKLAPQAALRRPSIIPEMLDGVGWAAMIAIVLGLAMFFVPGLDFSTQLAGTIGTTVLMAGFWIAYRCSVGTS